MTQFKRRRKQLWQFVYIFGTLALLIVLGVANPELAPLFHGTLPVRSGWMLLCGVAMLLFWFLQSCVYAHSAKMIGAHISFWRSVRVMMFGEYYSAITPFASGGQPMQLGYYKRYGVSAANASSILAVRYIGFVSSICLSYLAALVLEGSRILSEHPVIFWLTAMGFAVNLFSIVMVALLLFRASLAHGLGKWVIRMLTKIRPFQGKREKWEVGFENGMEEFTAAADCIRSHPWQCAFGLLLSIASVICQFSVSYFVYRGVGLSGASYWKLFSMQIYLYLAVSFAPTPGATGATEGGFYLFFAMLFPEPLLYSAMLLWRLFTYYSNLLLGAGLVIWDELQAMRRARSLKA